jgi:hypothetical protein
MGRPKKEETVVVSIRVPLSEFKPYEQATIKNNESVSAPLVMSVIRTMKNYVKRNGGKK